MVASVGLETTWRARRRCLFAEAADLAMLEMCNFHDSIEMVYLIQQQIMLQQRSEGAEEKRRCLRHEGSTLAAGELREF